MKVAEWLDQQEAENVDISRIELPAEIAFDDAPDETLYFAEVNFCGLFCRQEHPFATVERYGDWYLSRGLDRGAGLHPQGGHWQLVTRDKPLALRTAREHVEPPP